MPDSHKIVTLVRVSDPSDGDNLTIGECNLKSKISFKFDEEVLGETTIRFYKVRQNKISTLLNTKKLGETLIRDISSNKLDITSATIEAGTVKPKSHRNGVPAAATTDEARVGSTTFVNLENIVRSSSPISSGILSPERPHHLWQTRVQGERIPSSVHLEPKYTESLPPVHSSEVHKEGSSVFQTKGGCLSEDPIQRRFTVLPSEYYTLPNSCDSRTEVCSSKSQTERDQSKYDTEPCSSKTEVDICPAEFRNEQFPSEFKGVESKFQNHRLSVDQKEISASKIQYEYYPLESQSEKYHSDTLPGVQLPDTLSKDKLSDNSSECDFGDVLDEKVSDVHSEGSLSDIPNVVASRTVPEEQVLESPTGKVSDTNTEKCGPYASATEQFLDSQNKASDIQTEDHFLNATSAEVSDTHAELMFHASLEDYYLDSQNKEASDIQTKEENCFPDPTVADLSDFLNIQTEDRFSDTEVSDIRNEGRLSTDSAKEHFLDTEIKESLDVQTEERSPDTSTGELANTHSEGRLCDDSSEEYFLDFKTEQVSDNQIKERLSDASTAGHFPNVPYEEISKIQTEVILSHVPTKGASDFPGESNPSQISTAKRHYKTQIHFSEVPKEITEIQIDPSKTYVHHRCSEILTSEIRETLIESSEVQAQILKTETNNIETKSEKCYTKHEVQKFRLEAPTYIPDIHAYIFECYKSQRTSGKSSEICEVQAEERKTTEAHYPETEIRQDICKVCTGSIEVNHLEAPAEENISETSDDQYFLELQSVECPSSLATKMTEVQTDVLETSAEFCEVQTETLTDIFDFQAKLYPSETEIRQRSSEVYAENIEDKKLSKTQTEKPLLEIQNEVLKSVAVSLEISKKTEECPLGKELSLHTILRDQQQFRNEDLSKHEDVDFCKNGHDISAVTSEGLRRKIPANSLNTMKAESECSSYKTIQNLPVRSDQEAASQRLTAQCTAPEGSSEQASTNNITTAEHLGFSQTASPAYFVGDKICEFQPFVYVLNNGLIPVRCSYCFKAFVSLNKRRCRLCSCAYYCNNNCQIKHLPTHQKECAYLQRCTRSDLPNRFTRLQAHAMWRLEDPSALETCCTVGNKTYYYQDLPTHTGVLKFCPNIGSSVRTGYEALQSFVNDRSISFEKFHALYDKVNRQTVYIVDAPGEDIGIAMYFGLAAIEHSCRPNANITFIGTTAQIVACRDIEVADPHTVTLRFVPLTLSTASRQSVLEYCGRGPCSCELCESGEADELLKEVKGGDGADAVMDSVRDTLDHMEESLNVSEDDPEKLLTTAREALDAMEGVSGDFNCLRGRILEIASVLSGEMEDYQNIVTYHTHLLSIYRYVYGDNHPAIVNTLMSLSISFFNTGNRKAAREHFSQALQVACNAYGSEHPFVKSIRYGFIQQEECNWENDDMELGICDFMVTVYGL